MHFDQNLLFIIIVAIVGISRLIARVVENAREQSERTKRPTVRPQTRPVPRVTTSKEKTDEERIREFLEALGQPVGTAPPPRVRPRTDVPPRPVAPIPPPPMARPFSPVGSRPARQKRPRVLPPAVSKTADPTVFPAEANEPGTWIAQEEKIEAAAARFRTATSGIDETRRSIPPPALANWKDLLRSADSVRTAIVLREIFGPPRGVQPLEFTI